MRNCLAVTIAVSFWGLTSGMASAQPTTSNSTTPTSPRPPGVGTVYQYPAVTEQELTQLLGPPTLVTVQNGTINSIVEEFSRQSGLKFLNNAARQPPANEPLNFQVANKPFWMALDEFAQVTNIMADVDTTMRIFKEYSPETTKHIQLHPWRPARGVRARRVEQVNPYVALVFRGASANTSYDNLLGVSGNSALTFSAVTLFDPKLQSHPFSVAVNVNKATDGEGKSLTMRATHFQTNELHGQLMLSTTSPVTGKVASIQGTLKMIIGTKSENWEITDFKTPQGKVFKTDRGEIPFRFVKLSEDDNNYKLEIEADIPQSVEGSVDFKMDNFVTKWDKQVRVYDAAGTVHLTGGMSGRPGKYTMTLRKNPDRLPNQPIPGPPARLVIPIVTETKQLEIPFEIKDLLLP
jgi:hypothetical protein